MAKKDEATKLERLKALQSSRMIDLSASAYELRYRNLPRERLWEIEDRCARELRGDMLSYSQRLNIQGERIAVGRLLEHLTSVEDQP